MSRNCQRVKWQGTIIEGPREVTVLAEGWVGVAPNGDLRLRPDRGCGGYALYESEVAAIRNTGCSSAQRAALYLYL